MKKLNTHGIAHIIAPLIIVVVVATVGTFVLVKSHADPVNVAKPATSYPCTHYEYASGGSGSCVKDIQTIVSEAVTQSYGSGGLYVHYGGVKLTLDGQYGPKTKSAVIAFQKSSNSWWYSDDNSPCYHNNTCTLATDGIVGPQTWDELCTYMYNYVYENGVRDASVSAAKNAGCDFGS